MTALFGWFGIGKLHYYGASKREGICFETSQKYWCDITGDLKKSQEISNHENVNYVPEKAKAITSKKKKSWDIEHDDFSITYEKPEHLLDAFYEEIKYKKKKAQYATNYRSQVEYIWTMIGQEKV